MQTTVTAGTTPVKKKTTTKPVYKSPKAESAKVQPGTIQASPQEKSANNNTPIVPKSNVTLPEGVPQGYKPIRQTLNERNISNERIGFDDDGYVTIDGNKVIKPQYNIDGTTYADEATINQLTQDAYKRNGTPLVSTRDYATSRGYSDIVDWDGTNPTIGGVATPATYITDNGVSYIPQSEADRLINDYKLKNEIDGNRAVVEDVEKKYGSTEEVALDKIINRDAFKYSPENDVVFNSYKNQYQRSADEALRKILNENNTSIEGASGAVMSDAMAARDAELGKINDVIPELYQDAYNRYVQEDSLRRNDLDAVRLLANDYYNRHYAANRDQINDTNEAMASERAEKQRIFDNERTLKQQQFENDIYTNQEKRNQEMHNVDLATRNEALKKQIFDDGISTALARGFFTEQDEEWFPELSRYRKGDGTYSLHPAQAEADYNRIIGQTNYDVQSYAMKNYGFR